MREAHILGVAFGLVVSFPLLAFDGYANGKEIDHGQDVETMAIKLDRSIGRIVVALPFSC